MTLRHSLAISRMRTRITRGHRRPNPRYPKRYDFLEWSGTAREMDHL